MSVQLTEVAGQINGMVLNFSSKAGPTEQPKAKPLKKAA